MHHSHLRTGLRVRLSNASPIESEGVAPRPGHWGMLVAEPVAGDGRRCWAVRFDGLSLDWRIPEHLLEPPEENVEPLRPTSPARAA